MSKLTEKDLQPLCLDYASQENPQMLVNGYLPYKNAELLHDWWRGHYKATLQGGSDPMAALLHIKPHLVK